MYLTAAGTLLLLLLVACGGSSGGGDSNNTTVTFAKVYGGVDEITNADVYETEAGYEAILTDKLANYRGTTVTRLKVDKNGIALGNGANYISQKQLSYGVEQTAILSNGFVTVDTDINKISNSYTLNVSKKRYNTDPELLPTDDWNDAQQVDFSTSYWQSDDPDFDNKPAEIEEVYASVKVALSASGLTDIYVKVRESAYVQSYKFGELSLRERTLLYHYTPSGTLLGVKQISESSDDKPTPIYYKADNTKISVGFDGSYLVVKRNATITKRNSEDNVLGGEPNEYSTSYDLSFYGKDGGRNWTRTLGPFLSKGICSAEFGNRGATKGIVATIYNYQYSKIATGYLSLDANGNNRWDFDLDENAAEPVTPLHMACDYAGECLLVAMSSYTPRKLFIWNDSTQATTVDLSSTPVNTIPYKYFDRTQLQFWPDNIFRLLFAGYKEGQEKFEDYQFQISIGTNGVTANYNTQKLSEMLGGTIPTLTPFGMAKINNDFGHDLYTELYDTNGTALFAPGYSETSLERNTFLGNSLPRVENGLLYTKSSDRSGALLKLSDNGEYTKLASSLDETFRTIEFQKDNSLLIDTYNGVVKYDSNNTLVWRKKLRTVPEAVGNSDLNSAEFSNGDTLLVADIREETDYDDNTSIQTFKNYLLMSRITPDGVKVWQRLWDIDELKYTSIHYSRTVRNQNYYAGSMVTNVIKENGKDIPVVILTSNYDYRTDFAEDRMFNAISFDENDGNVTAVKHMSPVIKESYYNNSEGTYYGDFSHKLKLVSTSDGYLWLGFTSNTLTSRDTGVDEEGNPIALPYGADNIALLRLNGKLEVDRLRIYGAGDDEALTDLRVLKDGGLLVGATTKSFRLNDAQSDAWILRLDADGNIAEGCQALLAKLNGEPAAFHMGEHNGTLLAESNNTAAFYFRDETVSPTSLTQTSGTLNAIPKVLETARVCLGEITPPPVPDANESTGRNVVLTVIIEGGPGAGQVISNESPIPLMSCVNSNESTTTCTAQYQSTDTVSLSGNAFNNGILSWSGCTESFDEFERPVCNVDMTSNKTVTASFAPTNKLSLTIRGASPSGSTVRSNESPVLMFCSSTSTADKTCEAYFPVDALVFLTWNDFDGYGIQSWEGCAPQTMPTDGCMLTMGSDKSVIATFGP